MAEAAVTKKKIMVVEDEQSLLTLQSMLLSVEGYTVEGVMDGQTALDVVETMMLRSMLRSWMCRMT